MKIINALITMLGETDIPEDEKTKFKEFVSNLDKEVSLNPRDPTESNDKLLRAIFYAALTKTEYLYGDGDGTGVLPSPIFMNQGFAQIAPTVDDPKVFGLAIGYHSKTWEDVFYDICHESLHLLNPIADVKNKKISALEEGCAVKFAEAMHEKYIKPYSNNISPTSPINASNSQYYAAYNATKNIPDCILKKVREVFGRFSNINDFNKFKLLVGNYINDDEIKVLMSEFVYLQN